MEAMTLEEVETLLEGFTAEIDKGRLDEEWVQHPNLYHRLAVAGASMSTLKAQAYDKIKLQKAKMENRVRANPQDYEVEKVTESSVAAAVATSKLVMEAQAAYNEAAYHADLVAAAVAAMEHRKRALENLVKLWGGDYFSSPQVTDGAGRRGIRKATGGMKRVQLNEPDDDEE